MADALEKAALVGYLICMIGMVAVSVRLMARRMVTAARPSRRTFAIAGVFAVGTLVTGVLHFFML